MKEKKKVKWQIIISILGVVLIIVSIVLISKSFSSYQMRSIDLHLQESTKFYFESEISTIEGSNYNINNWDGTTTEEITIDIKNYHNKVLKTDEDIKYKIKANVTSGTELVEAKIYDDKDKLILADEELILSKEEFVKENYTLKIKPKSSLANDTKVEVQVVITSTNPYEKELKTNITLTVNKSKNIIGLINSKDGMYTTLNIKTNDISKDVKINYDNTKLIIDNSGYIVNGLKVTTNNNINTITIPKNKLEKSKYYEVIFIKKAESIVLGQDIVVE